MKQDEYSTPRPTLKRWSNRNPTVEPGGPDQRERASSPNQLDWKTLGRSLHLVRVPTRRRVIEESNKVVNRDWVNHQACSLSHNIHVLSDFFIANDYVSKLVRKIMPSNIFS